jgi:hypothetical protein
MKGLGAVFVVAPVLVAVAGAIGPGPVGPPAALAALTSCAALILSRLLPPVPSPSPIPRAGTVGEWVAGIADLSGALMTVAGWALSLAWAVGWWAP